MGLHAVSEQQERGELQPRAAGDRCSAPVLRQAAPPAAGPLRLFNGEQRPPKAGLSITL